MTTKEHSIRCTAPEVRAILDGRKTQTRRVVDLQPRSRADIGYHGHGLPFIRNPDPFRSPLRCPFGQPGDRLWVRETFSIECAVEHDQDPPHNDGRPTLWPEEGPRWRQPHYRATDPDPELSCERDNCRECREHDMGPHWRPSIHMPRWASRITLEVIGVRVERLQEISDHDCEAEGARPSMDGDARDWRADETGWRRTFRQLWDSVNGPGSWDTNPWVWVIEHKRVTP